MFCYFQRGKMDGIHKFQSIVLSWENEKRIEDKKMKKNRLAHRWFLTDATMSIIFMSEIVWLLMKYWSDKI